MWLVQGSIQAVRCECDWYRAAYRRCAVTGGGCHNCSSALMFTSKTLPTTIRYVETCVLSPNRCVTSRSVIGWRLPTQTTDGCGVGQLLCFRCTQAITADTVIAYITHDDRPSQYIISVNPAWRRVKLYFSKGLFTLRWQKWRPTLLTDSRIHAFNFNIAIQSISQPVNFISHKQAVKQQYKSYMYT